MCFPGRDSSHSSRRDLWVRGGRQDGKLEETDILITDLQCVNRVGSLLESRMLFAFVAWRCSGFLLPLYSVSARSGRSWKSIVSCVNEDILLVEHK